MTVGEFLWSMAFYILLFFISLELLMGTWNLACKKGWDVTKRISCFRNKADIEEGREREPFQIPKDFGKEMESAEPPPTVDAMTPSPPSPSCKLTEEQRAKLIAIYSQEWHELRLFTLRIQIPRVVASLRKLLALLSFILLVLCNAATVMFSGILTTMMFNSRVAECWKKAYLRSDKVDAEELDEPAPSAREPSGRDYRSQRRSTSRSNRLLPASMSRGIGALSSDPINVQPRGTQALSGAFSVPVRAPALSPGSPSSSSAQAAAKPLPPPPARQVPILGAMPPKVAPRMQPVQPRTTSLGTPSVPPPSGQGT